MENIFVNTVGIDADLDEVRHSEVHDVVFPCKLQDDVRMQEVVTLEQARREAVVRLVVKEVSQQVLKIETIRTLFFKQIHDLTSATSAFLDSAAYSIASLKRLS